MPIDKRIKKVLVIGSGPIVIGQAAEFDYAGAQACRVLRDAGVNVVLVNSNPATIMTDRALADEIYLEPLTEQTLMRIIEKEKPDSLLAGLGGQTGLTLSMQLYKSGFLDAHGVRLIGTNVDAIDRAGAARQRAANDALLAQLQVLETRLKNLEDTNANRLDGVRATLLQGMANIRADNNKKLDEIRGTVDEKLEATLQRRVSESFRAVSTQLEQVYKGLGEMQNLAADVGSLKQVLSGVKTRGILGEVQLGAILKEILAPGQYAENVATVPGSSNRVEYAVKLPGQSGTVWLPIDAKFPGDTYAHLQDAQASGDPAAVAAARRQLETVVRQEAKDIHDKYIEVPYTTAFGILFLPFEGLYAEVVNCGLPEILQRDYKINIAGPSTMAALLNALQMGFRTLAIQKRSGEVWQILGAVKTEFEKFGSGLQSMQRHLNQTGNDLEELIGTRSRAITRKLESVQQLEPTEAADLLGLAEGGSRISTQNSEIDRQDNAPRLRRKDDAGMPM